MSRRGVVRAVLLWLLVGASAKAMDGGPWAEWLLAALVVLPLPSLEERAARWVRSPGSLLAFAVVGWVVAVAALVAGWAEGTYARAMLATGDPRAALAAVRDEIARIAGATANAIDLGVLLGSASLGGLAGGVPAALAGRATWRTGPDRGRRRTYAVVGPALGVSVVAAALTTAAVTLVNGATDVRSERGVSTVAVALVLIVATVVTTFSACTVLVLWWVADVFAGLVPEPPPEPEAG